MIFQLFNKTGAFFLVKIAILGKIGALFFESIFGLFVPPFRFKLFIKQLEFIGNRSLSIVLFTALFTGMVLALQMYEALRKFQSESLVGGIVALSLTKELAPVLTSLMVNSRAGSAVAAEIGSMRVTEQIDALEAMAINSVQYLITPRVLAGFIMLPILTIIADVIGVIGGYLIAVQLLGLDAGLYINKIIDLVDIADILGGLFKASICSVTLILPISAATADPALELTIKEVSTGASSLVKERATIPPTRLSDWNFLKASYICKANTIPVKRAVNKTIDKERLPINSSCLIKSLKRNGGTNNPKMDSKNNAPILPKIAIFTKKNAPVLLNN